jgi:hypothetical protein
MPMVRPNSKGLRAWKGDYKTGKMVADFTCIPSSDPRALTDPAAAKTPAGKRSSRAARMSRGGRSAVEQPPRRLNLVVLNGLSAR